MSTAMQFQLLAAVLPLFTSDIEWSCDGSSEEKINVQNTGALMKVYLDEMRLYMSEEPSNLLAEVGALEEELEYLLHVLENLLTSNMLDESMPGSSSEYQADQQIIAKDARLSKLFPKLVRLSLLMKSSVDLNHRRFVCLSQKPLPFKMARHHAEVVLNKLRDLQKRDPTTTDLLPKKAPTSVWTTHFNPRLWSSSNDLFNTLEKHLKLCTKSQTKHRVMLHLKGYRELEQNNPHPRVDMLLASCPVSGSWPEVHCIVANSQDTAEAPCLTEEFDPVRDVCQDAYDIHDFNQIFKIRLEGDRLLNLSDLEDEDLHLEHPDASPSKSLLSLIEGDVLKGSYRFPEKHKRYLALNLAQSLLQLYNSRWVQKNWTSEGLIFRYGVDEAKVYNIHQPYLSCFLSSDAVYESDISDPRHKYPIVLSFGRLLMEIETGESIKVETTRTGRPDLLGTLQNRLKEWREDLNADYVSAIDACLKFQKLLPPGDKSQEAFRKVFLERIVRPLEREMARFPKSQPGKRDLEWKSKTTVERVLPHPTSQPNDRAPVSTILNSLYDHVNVPTLSVSPAAEWHHKPTRAVASLRGIAMFSDCDGDTSENKKQAAKSFLSRLEDFRKKHIHQPLCGSRVKIAVLDTGLQEEDFVIRQRRKAIRQNRRADAKEHRDPIQGTENFTEGPTHDEDGHGTDVVGLLLVVAPEANVYVGKISRQKKVGIQVQQISQALRWAIDEIKADIISMSFGFDNDSDWTFEMQKAIKDVDNADRIVFAAASNYGGNRKRTYPAKAPAVFCIHASDGDGNESGKDPTPLERTDNFSTIGVLVPCRFDGDREIFKTGTSYATPVAAGIAANIMVLGDWLVETKRLTSDQRRKLGAYEGMRSVFEQMAETRQRYDYVAPWHLWDGNADEETVWGKIRERL